jgi:uncharacterized protein
MIHEQIAGHCAELEKLCAEYEVELLELFGSGAREDFDPAKSDLDFLVVFRTPTKRDVVDQYFGLKKCLEDLFNRRVDLVERGQVKNPFVLLDIESQERKLLYAA